MSKSAYRNAKVAVHNPPAFLGLLPYILMRHICGEDTRCCVGKMRSLEVCLADCVLRCTHIDDMITDQMLRLWVICERTRQERLDSWETFKDACKARVVGCGFRCEDTVEEKEGFAVEDKSVKMEGLTDGFDVIKSRVFDRFGEKVIWKRHRGGCRQDLWTGCWELWIPVCRAGEAREKDCEDRAKDYNAHINCCRVTIQ